MIRKGKRTSLKAAALLLAALLVLCACAPKNGTNTNTDNGTEPKGNTQPSNEAVTPQPSGNEADPDDGLTEEQRLYRDLKALCEAAWNNGEGELSVEKTYSRTTVLSSGTGWNTEGQDNFSTSFYTDKDGRVNMVRLVFLDGEAPRDGELQYEGIRYRYTQTEHEDGTVEWVEGAAVSGQTELPIPEALLFDLPEFGELDSIKFEYSCYRLSVGRSFRRMLTDDSSVNSAYYILEGVIAEYDLDADGNLSGCTWMYTENWTEDGAAVSNYVTARVHLEKDRTPMPTTWFRDSTNYVRPEYPDITETAREEHINLPGKIVFDVRIPKIKDGLAGADALNRIIEKDLEYEMTMDEAKLAEQTYEDYIVRRADYSVIKVGKYYEILVDCSMGSAEGSGAATWGHRYFYVPSKGGVTAEQFLGLMGYDRESFLAAADEDEFYTDYSGQKMTEDFTYEELLGMFYFDENGTLVFVPDLIF